MLILLFNLASSAFKAVSFSVNVEFTSPNLDVTIPSTLDISLTLLEVSVAIAWALASAFSLTGVTAAVICAGVAFLANSEFTSEVSALPFILEDKSVAKSDSAILSTNFL